MEHLRTLKTWTKTYIPTKNTKGRVTIRVILQHGTTQYGVGQQVANASGFRLYMADDVETGKQYLLQVAADIANNGDLDRAAFVLDNLKQTADNVQAAYAVEYPTGNLNYDQLFPLIVDSFISSEQGKRRINVLAIKDIGAITDLVPLSNLLARDRLRIDTETSAWIMGRLLKLMSLVHLDGVAIQLLLGNNILIEPKNHRMVVLDWSRAHTYQQEVPADQVQADIVMAAKTVFTAIGGDARTGEFAYADNDKREQYVALLWQLASGHYNNAEHARQQFYTLLDELYGTTFHPFTTLPLR